MEHCGRCPHRIEHPRREFAFGNITDFYCDHESRRNLKPPERWIGFIDAKPEWCPKQPASLPGQLGLF